jgi:formiminotetrahydrofolate cyclodeaminase
MSDHTGARVTRWLVNDMRALARLVDAADVAALTDEEVSSARRHLQESLEAADRAAGRSICGDAGQ